MEEKNTNNIPKKRFLVVEDDITIRLILNRFLSPYGLVDTVVDGVEAVEAYSIALCEKRPYDLITLDIGLPIMDGHDVLLKIRQIEQENRIQGDEVVKVIMISASSDKSDILSAFNAQCESYIVKPVKRASLLEQLRVFGLIE